MGLRYCEYCTRSYTQILRLGKAHIGFMVASEKNITSYLITVDGNAQEKRQAFHREFLWVDIPTE